MKVISKLKQETRYTLELNDAEIHLLKELLLKKLNTTVGGKTYGDYDSPSKRLMEDLNEALVMVAS